MTTPLERVVVVARALRGLAVPCVFTGGAVVPLYIDHARPADVRSTLDVDVVVEAATRTDYYLIEERLRGAGWTQPLLEGSPICRWQTPDGIIVDVLSTDQTVLGFSNRWYAPGLQHPLVVPVGDDDEIRVFEAPLFLATKIEAFLSRGKGDWYASHDLEDVFAVLEGRSTFGDEAAAATLPTREFLAAWAQQLFSRPEHLDIIEAHLSREAQRSGRLKIVLQNVQRLGALEG